MTSELDELYQELILDHNRRPRNRRRPADPDRSAEGYNPLCGDRITVFIRLEDEVIADVAFEGSGCAISTASASLMTESLRGRTRADAVALFESFHRLLTGEGEGEGERKDAAGNLGKLRVFSGVCRYPVRIKCATLAWHTVKAALENETATVSTE